MKYRFNEKEHVHQATRDGEVWEALYGTTSVINDVYPPPLAWYGSGKALELLGYITAKKEPNALKRKTLAEEGMRKVEAILAHELKLDKYMEFLDKCYKNHDEYKKARGKAGTDMHAKIEDYIKLCLDRTDTLDGYSFKGHPIAYSETMNYEGKDYSAIKSFVQWACENVEKFLWSEANCFSEKLWCGGITDFGFVHKNGMKIIGDAKPAVYPKHFIQTAAYGIYIRENGLYDARGKRIMEPMSVDGYCILDYEKGVARYLSGEWVARLESDFVHTVDMFKRKDVIGDLKL